MAHKVMKLVNTLAASSATEGVIINAVDISMFDRFAVEYKNNNRSGSFVKLKVQHRFDVIVSASDAANWIQIPTTTLPQPSALALSATVLTGPIDNAYKYIRVIGQGNTGIASGTVTITLGGMRR